MGETLRTPVSCLMYFPQQVPEGVSSHSLILLPSARYGPDEVAMPFFLWLQLQRLQPFTDCRVWIVCLKAVQMILDSH